MMALDKNGSIGILISKLPILVILLFSKLRAPIKVRTLREFFKLSSSGLLIYGKEITSLMFKDLSLKTTF